MQSFSSANKNNSIFFRWLHKSQNNSQLIVFRIVFGMLLFYHFAAALWNGTIYNNFIEPPFTFTYIGFEFLQPLPGNGMYIYIGIMLLLALLIILGAWYRLAMTGFTLLWTVLYLMQKSDYNNHYYLMLLLCWIMIFMPANRYCSVDVKRKAVTETTTCYRYYILVFIVQVAIVYFFASISKLTSEWFSGKYIAIQFSGLTHRFITGNFYSQRWFQLFICYGGFLFDLLIVPLLLWKKTRNIAFLISCLFHLFNSYTFSIGIFPYLSIAFSLFFFEPAVVQRLFFRSKKALANEPAIETGNETGKKLLIYCFGIYLFFQLIIPMRSWLFPGNVFWTEEGYRMSWKMMLRTKSGTVHFKIVDHISDKAWYLYPEKIFKPKQMMWLSISPDIIWQYAQRLKKGFEKQSIYNVEIYAISKVSLNRSKPMPLIDSTVNLAAVKWEPFRHSKWITDR